MSEAPKKTEPVFGLVGERLSLDFVNTVGGCRPARASEHLHAYEDLVAFGRQSGLATEAQARGLLAESRRRPGEAASALADAVELREALYRVFVAIAEGRAAPADDLETLNRALSRALAHRRVVPEAGGYAFAWEDAPGALDAPLWPIAADAADLLAGCDLRRVRVCSAHENEECGWLFFDVTKSGTRRWCSMRDCGNRAKARRHYHRSKGRGGG